jgi:methoxymalonate biosynthesis acyl carrier protein
MTDQTVEASPLTAEAIESALTAYLTEKTRTTTEIKPDEDVFASGLVTSMFAMQLVVHLESTYDIAIIGPASTVWSVMTPPFRSRRNLRRSSGRTCLPARGRAGDHRAGNWRRRSARRAR